MDTLSREEIILSQKCQLVDTYQDKCVLSIGGSVQIIGQTTESLKLHQQDILALFVHEDFALTLGSDAYLKYTNLVTG